MTYGDIVARFFYEAVPTLPASPAVKFEAISAAVFGGKQRRYGPMPSPEAQVGIRDIIRRSNSYLTFLVPWASSKQKAGDKLDVLEFAALRQLACMRDELSRLGVRSHFVIRSDDHTDRWLFGDSRLADIGEYSLTLDALIRAVLPESQLVHESDIVTWAEFNETASNVLPMFYRVLSGLSPAHDLLKIGWKGTISQEQRDYYYAAYEVYYPGDDPVKHLSRYFASTLARVQTKANATPSGDHIQISFTKPVPGNPVVGNRLYFRTLPERYTHHHSVPWGTKGYMQVSPDGGCRPRYASHDKVEDKLVEHTVRLGDASIQAPYAEEK